MSHEDSVTAIDVLEPPTHELGDAAELRHYLGEPDAPSQMSAADIKNAKGGSIFKHYAGFLPWLRPYWRHESDIPARETQRAAWEKAVACEGGWVPITQGWEPKDSQALWLNLERLLPLFADPTVEEIWVQRLENLPTPRGFLDVMSDGLLGQRIHPELRMQEQELFNAFTTLLAKTPAGTFYSAERLDGAVIIQSPLEPQGMRLAGGVPPVSTAPFVAIRIPARQRPTLEHLTGLKAFGKDYDQAMVAPGKPLPIEEQTPLDQVKKAMEHGQPKGRVMLPLEALEYLSATAKVGWNVVFSGATSSAKTTVLNASIALLPSHWRMVTMEVGVAELRPPHLNWLPLFADESLKDTKGNQLLSQEKVLSLALRLSPKPIPAGEIRGTEGALWVRATLTGHEASPTTIHSGSPDECIMRLTSDMILKANPGMSEANARTTACRAANVIVQLARQDVVVDGRIVSRRRCVSIHEVLVDGSYIAQDQTIRLLEVFRTERGENGEPILAYAGQSRLWTALRDRYLHEEIPTWALEGGSQGER
jgi:type IV secretory pathway ATPase VirB11/archaellum biosynthesis ATPase